MQSPSTEFINTMVKAGAGAGKTYGLIQKIVNLTRESLGKHSDQPPRFVVTTFTRKATQEVRERLLAKALEIKKTDPVFGEQFLGFLKSSGQLLISTIHGVLNQFLRQHGNLIGLDPDFKLVESSEINLNLLLNDFLESHSQTPELVNKFGWRRLKAFLIEHHSAFIFNPSIEPLTSDFFVAHWRTVLEELESNVIAVTPYINELLIKSKSDTLKRYADSLSAISVLLKNSSLNIWDRLDQLRLLSQNVPKNLGAMKNWPEESKVLKKLISSGLNEIIDDAWTVRGNFDDQMKTQQKLSDLARVFSQAWLKKKISLGELGLEDLELLSLYLLRVFPEESKGFSESWNYWFIDEYQDTSPIQVEILNNLIGNCPHYVVGDPQQSIYFFRGARSKVFHEKLQSFADLGAKVEHKTVNRRSSSPTLNLINDLMDIVNPHQFTKMDTLSENQSDDLLVGHFYLYDESENSVSNGVNRILSSLLDKGIEPSKIAILCRENSELQSLYTSIKAEGMPVQITSQGRFLEDREVKDALALWHFLVNPYDDRNLVELLRSTSFNVSDEELFDVCQKIQSPLWLQIQNMNNPNVLLLKEALFTINTKGHFETWQSLLLNSSIFNLAHTKDPSGRKEGNLWKLILSISQALRNGTLNIADPLEISLSTDTNNINEADSIREANQIQLMTIHASKGLEFEHVLLPFLNHERKKEGSGFFTKDLSYKNWTVSLIDPITRESHPSFFAKNVADEIHNLLSEESERLFYVAITRSKKGLYFFIPQTIDNVSNTGWAKHLIGFTQKGQGVFKDQNETYEFHVDEIKNLSYISNETKSAQEIYEPVVPMELGFYPETESQSITALIDKSAKGPIVDYDQFDIRNLERGVQIHSQLESLSLQKENRLPQEHDLLILDDPEFPLGEIIANGNPEWSFTIKLPNRIIEGQIDLWGFDSKDQLWIIDYKTGSQKYVERAFEQLQLYACALKKLDKINNQMTVNLAVYYPLKKAYTIRRAPVDKLLLFEEP